RIQLTVPLSIRYLRPFRNTSAPEGRKSSGQFQHVASLMLASEMNVVADPSRATNTVPRDRPGPGQLLTVPITPPVAWSTNSVSVPSEEMNVSLARVASAHTKPLFTCGPLLARRPTTIPGL